MVVDAHGQVTRGAASGARPAIVMVHGIGTSHRYFSRLHRELESNGTVYPLDLPGFGGSPKAGVLGEPPLRSFVSGA